MKHLDITKKPPYNIDDAVSEYVDELTGIEHELEETDHDSNTDDITEEKPFDADKIRVELRTLSLKYIRELTEDKLLHLNPEFQRHKVWKERKRKSLLIESLMLRIPIPAFYFYEDEDSCLHVIDGLQRLTTINEFLNDEFKLSGLQYLEQSCGNKYFSQLEPKYVSRINQTQLTINVIDARTPSQVKFDIFRRINTGGVPLNAQELRHSISKGRTRSFLKKLAYSPEFIQATGNGVNDLRMAAQELVLRFVAFYDAYDPINKEINYKKPIDSFLDLAFEDLNSMPKAKLAKYEILFLNSMENAYILFGPYAFRNCQPDDLQPGAKKKLINKSLFTSWSVILARYSPDEIKNLGLKNTLLTNLANEIKNNIDYAQSLTNGTGDVRRIRKHFEIAQRLIDEVTIDD